MSGGPYPKKRQWRNLLLDTNYQLGFTLVLVLSSALFMTGLGYVVMRETHTATTTAIQDVQRREGDGYIGTDVAQITIGHLRDRERLIQGVLIGLGVALSVGLFLYGIKMTHRVAGPLYKVSTYCDKLAAEKFDKVYDLRKGDYLVSFYAHFKQAHEALRRHQERDVECLREVIAAAERSEQAAQPEVAAALQDLRAVLARKEASLG